MQLSKTSSAVSPLATTQSPPPSFSCEQRLADSTTTLGEDPLPYHLATSDHSPPPIKTERAETTVMAMGYAIGGGASDSVGGADIDLTDILTDSTSDVFNTGGGRRISSSSIYNRNNEQQVRKREREGG